MMMDYRFAMYTTNYRRRQLMKEAEQDRLAGIALSRNRASLRGIFNLVRKGMRIRIVIPVRSTESPGIKPVPEL
jgi:hypothetical protein